ncbi:Membrane-anchored ribosome-binding protein, inhibits growth in stationary phase, ElaB/YqjD/DUF883 family [Geopseudomonas sagittaria]|uniref:Membrane-anchored ribosome-binding protein, inhibits growth in stationary phase, ElaB/YqjD/DUF883 family n=1 Tax=Geopseudomonas sagittaria TaxID=1135990 RepID=A0A1I5SR34_9GAMM|nr:DUF883 family protein [Pseudomonas sagittaria]MCM2330661.1 DUF883 family protein [Pseudomonas sagittaria]SFP72977.1 Membrane-anchored ribosome-binding protein, inhibits growth in stationary phase, ElaB/YqjD/DUF883 family [Pseudomonas sagittaria]
MAHKTPSMDPLLADFQALVQDTEKLLQQSASLVGDQAEGLREQIQASLVRARKSLNANEESMRQCCKAGVEATEHYVQAHPLQSLGLCAGVGFLLGMLIARR